MARWQRWMVGAALVAAGIVGGRAFGDVVALFPGALFQFVPPAGLIRAEHFIPVAEEVEAIEAVLGVNLGNIAKTRTGGAVLGEPLAGDAVPMFFHAPEAGALTRILCETRGTNSEVTINVNLDDGSPANVAVTTCSETLSSFVLAVPMARDERLDLVLGQVNGAPESVSVRIEFQPGA